MSTAQQRQIAEQEFLEGECEAEVKHELVDGRVYAMSTTTDVHNSITGNTFAQIWQQLKGQSREAFILSILLKAGNNYFYPDVMVTNGEDAADTPRVRNAPIVIIEVLSPSSRKTDITTKKTAYQNIPSLQEYILIEQDKCEVVVFRRNEN